MVIDSPVDICVASYILPRAWEKIRDGKILRSAERELDGYCQHRLVHGRKGKLKGRKSKALPYQGEKKGEYKRHLLSGRHGEYLLTTRAGSSGRRMSAQV